MAEGRLAMAPSRVPSETSPSESSHAWSTHCFSGFFRSLNALLEVLNQLWQGRVNGCAPVPQLNEVQSALTAFDITDERLGASKSFRQLGLSQVCRDPGVSQ